MNLLLLTKTFLVIALLLRNILTVSILAGTFSYFNRLSEVCVRQSMFQLWALFPSSQSHYSVTFSLPKSPSLCEAATDFLPLTPGIFPLSDSCVVIDKIHSAIAVSSLF